MAAAGWVVYLLAPQTIGETSRRHFLNRLRDHYRDYQVSIGRGHFDPQIGLIFEDIRIAQPALDSFLGRQREMIRIERMTLISDVCPDKLLDQQIPLTTKKVVLQGVQATAWLTDQGHLCLQDLLPLPAMGPVVPLIEIRRAKIQLVDRQTRSRPIEVELGDVLMRNAVRGDGTIDQKISIRGSADFADDLLVRIEQNEHTIGVQAKVSRVYLSRKLFDRLPGPWAKLIDDAKDLQCVCDAGLVLRRDAGGQLDYKLKTTIHQGQFDHPKLPQPITDLRGVVELDPNGVTIMASHGVFRDAVVRADGRVDGTKWPCDVDLRLSAAGLMLDDRLSAALPPAVQTAWNKLQPNGRIDIVDANLRHQQGQWTVRIGRLHCGRCEL